MCEVETVVVERVQLVLGNNLLQIAIDCNRGHASAMHGAQNRTTHVVSTLPASLP